jgi:large subunit ribosomal protein L6
MLCKLNKNIQIILPNPVKLLVIKNQKFIVFNNKEYFYIPNTYKLTFLNNKLNIFYQQKDTFFIQKIRYFIKKLSFPFTKKLIFRGLGLKFNLAENKKYIEFKLGYSHLIKLKIPENIKIKMLKNSIVFSSSNKVLLGNYIYKVKKLKMPNIYKGKGIWYKGEKIKLKPIKKN